MAIFTSIIEKALRDTSKKNKKISESAGFGDDEMEDISLQDMFQDDSEVDTGLGDTGSDFYELEAEEDFGSVNFDEEKAKEEKGDEWFTELKEPIESYLKDSTNPVFLKGDLEIDKPSLETALAELFKHLGVSPFSGNVIEDGSIKVAQREAGEEETAEDSLLGVDGVAGAVNGGDLPEAYEEEEPANLMPMNDAAGDAEIVSLNVEWDGTSVGIGDMDVEYAEDKVLDDEESEEGIEEDPDEQDEEPEEDDEEELEEVSDEEDEEEVDEGEEDDEISESLTAEEILNYQSMIDEWEKEDSSVLESSLSDGGAKDEKVGEPDSSLSPSSYSFNNGGDDSNFVDGVEDLEAVEDSTDTSEPRKSGEFFRGTFEGDEAPTESDESVDVSKPKIDDFLPNTEEIVSALEKETIRESVEFDNGGEPVNVGDLEMSDIDSDVGENADMEDFVWDSEFVEGDGNLDDVSLSKFRDGDETPLTAKKSNPEKDFLSDEDQMIDGAPVARQEQ